MAAAPTVSERVSLKTEFDSLINKALESAARDNDTRNRKFVAQQYIRTKNALKRLYEEYPDDSEVNLAHQIMLVLTGHQATSHPISHLFRPITEEADKSLFEPLLDTLMDCTYSFPYRCFVAFFWGPTPPSSYTMMIEGLQALKTPALQVLNSAVKGKKCAIEAFHPKVQAEMKEALAASGPSGKAAARAITFFRTTLSTVPEESETSSEITPVISPA